MLNQYRNQINQLDDEIIALLDKRFAITKAVGDYKRANGIEVLNQAREEIIINRIKACNLEYEHDVIAVYLALMDISKDQQNG